MNTNDEAERISRINNPRNRDNPTAYDRWYAMCPTCGKRNTLRNVTVRQAHEGEQRHEECQ